MKKWCPLAQAVCEDGYVSSDYPCAYWDLIEGRCMMVESAFLQVSRMRTREEGGGAPGCLE